MSWTVKKNGTPLAGVVLSSLRPVISGRAREVSSEIVLVTRGSGVHITHGDLIEIANGSTIYVSGPAEIIERAYINDQPTAIAGESWKIITSAQIAPLAIAFFPRNDPSLLRTVRESPVARLQWLIGRINAQAGSTLISTDFSHMTAGTSVSTDHPFDTPWFNADYNGGQWLGMLTSTAAMGAIDLWFRAGSSGALIPYTTDAISPGVNAKEITDAKTAAAIAATTPVVGGNTVIGGVVSMRVRDDVTKVRNAVKVWYGPELKSVWTSQDAGSVALYGLKWADPVYDSSITVWQKAKSVADAAIAKTAAMLVTGTVKIRWDPDIEVGKYIWIHQTQHHDGGASHTERKGFVLSLRPEWPDYAVDGTTIPDDPLFLNIELNNDPYSPPNLAPIAANSGGGGGSGGGGCPTGQHLEGGVCVPDKPVVVPPTQPKFGDKPTWIVPITFPTTGGAGSHNFIGQYPHVWAHDALYPYGYGSDSLFFGHTGAIYPPVIMDPNVIPGGRAIVSDSGTDVWFMPDKAQWYYQPAAFHDRLYYSLGSGSKRRMLSIAPGWATGSKKILRATLYLGLNVQSDTTAAVPTQVAIIADPKGGYQFGSISGNDILTKTLLRDDFQFHGSIYADLANSAKSRVAFDLSLLEFAAIDRGGVIQTGYWLGVAAVADPTGTDKVAHTGTNGDVLFAWPDGHEAHFTSGAISKLNGGHKVTASELTHSGISGPTLWDAVHPTAQLGFDPTKPVTGHDGFCYALIMVDDNGASSSQGPVGPIDWDFWDANTNGFAGGIPSTALTLPAYEMGSLSVWLNGKLLKSGVDYFELYTSADKTGGIPPHLIYFDATLRPAGLLVDTTPISGGGTLLTGADKLRIRYTPWQG